jgi:hypothetical protein
MQIPPATALLKAGRSLDPVANIKVAILRWLSDLYEGVRR